MNRSIQSRLILSSSVVLFCFLGLAGFVLDAAYKQGAQSALNDRLQIHLYSILAVAEVSKKNRLVMPSSLSEPRFSQIDSGLYAYIFNDNAQAVWRSISSAGETIEPAQHLKPGQKTYIKTDKNGVASIALHYKATLESVFGQTTPFEFVVIDSTLGVAHQVAGFRSVLWQWLGGIGVFLILLQFWIIRFSLQPLQNIVSDLEKIHQGEKQSLENHYSDELKDIANTLNRLIDNERSHLRRYRDTLADLAHSLKTPLSVLTGIYEQKKLTDIDKKTIKSQTLIMGQLVDYQLQKAAAKGSQTLSKALDIKSIVQQVIDSLEKVYAEKALRVVCHIEQGLRFKAEKGDLFELFGNLLDNAFKWANSEVRIDINSSNNKNSKDIQIIIEDDGPGIPDDELKNVLRRGIRADQSVNGHGIGLAVVNELVSLYKGQLKSEKAASGGQKWIVTLPKSLF